MSKEQKNQFITQNQNDPALRRFATDYMNDPNRNLNQTPPPQQTPPQNQTPQVDQNQNYGGSQSFSTPNYDGNKQFDPNAQFDSSRMNNPNAQVSVKVGNAQQTGRPDYEDDSDARMSEITNNLNAYFRDNREFFRDRETFNKVFDYGKRSDKQKVHFDSFWKRKQDESRVSGYADGNGVYEGMNNGDLTADQMSILQQQYPDIYKQYQDKVKEVENLRIANQTVPADPTANADLLKMLTERLGINTDMPYDYLKRWDNALEKYGILRDSENLYKMQGDIRETYDAAASLTERMMSEYQGRASAGYINAKISKATAHLYQRADGLQRAYSALLQGRQQNLAIAMQDMQALHAQSQEDQRIFNQKLQGLGFSMTVASYETPEQQRQAQLRQLEKQNAIGLQHQKNLNDLSLQFEKDKNRLQADLTDLETKDPAQLKSNLYNALTPYFKDYSSIIQRSQSGVVSDIINYAKQHGVSIAEAMRKNFIEPLQNKPHYQAMINKKMGYDPNAGQQKWTRTQGADGKVKLSISGTGQIPNNLTRQERTQTYSDRFTQATSLEDVGEIVSTFQDGATGGRCGEFANDLSKAMGANVHFGSKLSEKTSPSGNYTKSTTPQVGSFAIFNSKGFPENGHVGMVVKVNEDGSFVMKSSNRGGDKKIYTSTHKAGEALSFIVPEVKFGEKQAYDPELEDYYIKLQGGKSLTKEDRKTIESKTTRSDFLSGKVAYKNAKDQEVAPFAQELIQQLRNLKEMDSWTFKGVWMGGIPGTDSAKYRADYDRVLSSVALQKLIDLKSQGATFGALSNQELSFITNASTNLRLSLKYDHFMDEIDKMIAKLQKGVSSVGGGVNLNLGEGGGGKTSLFSDMQKESGF